MSWSQPADWGRTADPPGWVIAYPRTSGSCRIRESIRRFVDSAPCRRPHSVPSMTNTVAHFAINADDVPATRRFYETVFGWTFAAFGPPDFYRINPGGGPVGALQKRRDLVEGQRTVRYEGTIAVDDVDATARAGVAAGGRIIMARTPIAGCGDLIFFADPPGHAPGAMRYDRA